MLLLAICMSIMVNNEINIAHNILNSNEESGKIIKNMWSHPSLALESSLSMKHLVHFFDAGATWVVC